MHLHGLARISFNWKVFVIERQTGSTGYHSLQFKVKCVLTYKILLLCTVVLNQLMHNETKANMVLSHVYNTNVTRVWSQAHETIVFTTTVHCLKSRTLNYCNLGLWQSKVLTIVSHMKTMLKCLWSRVMYWKELLPQGALHIEGLNTLKPSWQSETTHNTCNWDITSQPW